MELMAKGIGRDLVDAALEEEYVSDDQKKIAELLQKRHYSFEDADVSEQRKNYQFYSAGDSKAVISFMS